jgi:hypothetical protein
MPNLPVARQYLVAVSGKIWDELLHHVRLLDCCWNVTQFRYTPCQLPAGKSSVCKFTLTLPPHRRGFGQMIFSVASCFTFAGILKCVE